MSDGRIGPPPHGDPARADLRGASHVVYKRRHDRDGEVAAEVYYAVGPHRASLAEAQADVEAIAGREGR